MLRDGCTTPRNAALFVCFLFFLANLELCSQRCLDCFISLGTRSLTRNGSHGSMGL